MTLSLPSPLSLLKLPNVDWRPPLLLPLHVFLFVLYNKSLNDWSLGKQLILFPSAAPRGNIEILGQQNELFPSEPVIKCLLFLIWIFHRYLYNKKTLHGHFQVRIFSSRADGICTRSLRSLVRDTTISTRR